MKILALDVSRKTGVSIFDGDKLHNYFLIKQDIKPVFKYGSYPYNVLLAAREMSDALFALINQEDPDMIIVEDTNPSSKSRLGTRILEQIHCLLLLKLENTKYMDRFKYINTGEWRSKLGISTPKLRKIVKANEKALKDMKNQLAQLKLSRQSKRKTDQEKYLELAAKKFRAEKMQSCLLGKVNRKTAVIVWVNNRFDLKLSRKDNDISDSIGLGYSYILGATCNSDIK